MQTGARAKAVIRGVIVYIFALTLFGVTGTRSSAGPAEVAPLSANSLAGNTLSAVVFVERSAVASSRNTLGRYLLQAYLRQGGSASVRIWVAARNAYTVTAERNWTVSGDLLCLDTPQPLAGQICAHVHIWGPRIAGIGTNPYVMLDGDLRPGNAIFTTH